MSENRGQLCGAELRITYPHCPPEYRAFLETEPDPRDQGERQRCVLEAGHVGDHYSPSGRAIPDYPGDIWTSGQGDRPPARMEPAWDCRVYVPRSLDHQACMLPYGHEGAHSGPLTDPSGEAAHV